MTDLRIQSACDAHPDLPPFHRLLRWAAVTSLLCSASIAAGQERWYQIEVSVFSNDNPADHAAEKWDIEPGQLRYPDRVRRLKTLLDVLVTPSLLPPAMVEEQATTVINLDSPDDSVPAATEPEPPSPGDLLRDALSAVGPFAARPGKQLKLLDFARDEFLHLPSSASDFQQTNRALERSGEHRLLYHSLWRQPMTSETEAQALQIEGGELYGEHYELEGSLRFYFNETETRVIADAELWLSEFVLAELDETAAAPRSAGPVNNRLSYPAPAISPALGETMDNTEAARQTSDDREAVLPDRAVPLPEFVQHEMVNARLADEPAPRQWLPQRSFHFSQTRPMRSEEFHYLDHPALGLVVSITPYERPPEAEAFSQAGDEP